MFPVAPKHEAATADGGRELFFDLNGDGGADYAEVRSSSGRVVALRYDVNEGSSANGSASVVLDEIPSSDCRQLLILLDSIPYGLVKEAWDQGRFRRFYPPSRTISPFPVMTDLSFSEFFGVSPALAVESQYYDGQRLHGGYGAYADGENTGWANRVQYRMIPLAHAAAYLDPQPWYDHELYEIQQQFLAGKEQFFAGYVVGTSAIGAHRGRNGHMEALVRLDRMCQQIIHDTRGRVQITLMSDHGHNLMHSELVPLDELLPRFGYRVTEQLERPEDVVLPQFGVVSCAAIHTKSPARVAADVVSIEGIDVAMYAQGDAVIVLSRDGLARVTRQGERFCYEAQRGDPLHLLPVLEQLRSRGVDTAGGCAEDRVWFDATIDGEYPDALQRIWRAFHGLITHTPDVLVSIRDGWHFGSRYMTNVVRIQSTHGNLNPRGSSGFVMTTAGKLPPVMRMADLAEELRRIGVAIPPPPR